MPLTLRQVLYLPYVILIAATALAIAALSYRAGSNAVDDVSDRYIRETVGRISQAIERHLFGSEAVLEAAFPNGIPAPRSIAEDLGPLRMRMWVASSLHTDPNHYVYYGNQDGQFLGLDRKSADRAEVRLKVDPMAHRRIHQIQGVLGPLDEGVLESSFFDPRQRPWYQTGAQAASLVWTSVYIDFKTRELISTRARRLLNDEGQLEGVVATDVSLRALNDFLSKLEITEHGAAAVLEPNGLLIGASSGANLHQLPDGQFERLPAQSASDPLIRAAFAATKDAIPELTRAQPMRMLRFKDTQGELAYGAVSRVRDDLGLDWVTIVAIPQADLVGGMNASLRRAAAIGALALGLCIALGWWTLNWIERDLRKISDAARRIGDGELDVALDLRRQDEIGQLGKSFMTMQHQLGTDALTGVSNRRGFAAKLRQLMAPAAQGGTSSFSVLLIDLDRFKQVNDVLGHPAGDAVLIEVAQRISACFEPGDTVARLGGDEFAVIMCRAASPNEVADRLRTVERSVVQPSRCVDAAALVATGFGISLGHANYPVDGDTFDTLLDAADKRMYSAKLDGRRRSQFAGDPGPPIDPVAPSDRA